MSTRFPPLMQKSHDDGSEAALQTFFAFILIWEALFHVARFSLKTVLTLYPSLSAHGSKHHSGNGRISTKEQRKLSDSGEHTLLQRGPSYAVSLIHSIVVTGRGVMHLYHLWNASNFDKLLIPGKDLVNSYRSAHLRVTATNTMFLSYLIYDLFHIVMQFPKLGGVDTIMHHLLFALCSVINGTYGIMPFSFGWLIVGELSTIFLNLRWFLLKSGRERTALLDKINGLFAATFFLTRIGIYSAGVIHLFYYSFPELCRLPDESGVPVAFLGLTCGCILLGLGLNILWGYKILGMVTKPKNA